MNRAFGHAGRRVGVAAAAVVVLAYGWWATALRPFTDPALAATLGAGLAAAGVGTVLRRRTGAPHRPPRRGMAVWAVLFIALGVWELSAFLQHPRSEHPTLSAISNSVLEAHPLRALAFAVWLAAGVDIARR